MNKKEIEEIFPGVWNQPYLERMSLENSFFGSVEIYGTLMILPNNSWQDDIHAWEKSFDTDIRVPI